jgi:uncharacterized membrane protein
VPGAGTPPIEDERATARIEAFSDGVFAIAITLLVLDLQVPRGRPDGTTLLRALVAQWPGYLAFVTSFATIGIMWINHHRLFSIIRRSDHMLLVFNGLLLLGVTFVPFPTALVAVYIKHPGAAVAAGVYNGTFVIISVFFNLLWRYASSGKRLLRHSAGGAEIQAITRAYSYGPALYGLAFLLALISVPASLAVDVGLALFWSLPPRRP